MQNKSFIEEKEKTQQQIAVMDWLTMHGDQSYQKNSSAIFAENMYQFGILDISHCLYPTKGVKG